MWLTGTGDIGIVYCVDLPRTLEIAAEVVARSVRLILKRYIAPDSV